MILSIWGGSQRSDPLWRTSYCRFEEDPSGGLSEMQRAVLARLGAAQTELRAADPRIAVALVRVPHGEVGFGWALRQSSGGHVPEPIGETPAERLLSLIARDCYPALLSPQDATLPFGLWASLPAAPPSIGLAHVVDSHLLLPELSNALANDVERSRDMLLATAMGVAPVAEAFDPESLLSVAQRRLRHDPRASPELFMSHAVDCLRELVHAADGAAAPVRALIGFSGMPTDDAWLPLAQGTLRRATPAEASYAPVGIRADAVLETKLEAVAVARGQDTGVAQISGQHRLAAGLGRELCLAAALAYEPRPPVSAPAIAWTTELAPGGGEAAFIPTIRACITARPRPINRAATRPWRDGRS